MVRLSRLNAMREHRRAAPVLGLAGYDIDTLINTPSPAKGTARTTRLPVTPLRKGAALNTAHSLHRAPRLRPLLRPRLRPARRAQGVGRRAQGATTTESDI